jgi:uncharacterized protein with PIN domain
MDDEAPRLLADCMLGRLAKWLRLLGYDTAYDNAATDLELARRARSEARVLLTRDQELAARTGLRTLLIESQVLDDQVSQVAANLPRPPHPPCTRCAVCNSLLRAVTTEEITHLVPPYVLSKHRQFHRCPGCGRVYWPGSHFRAIREQIARFSAHDGADG